MTRALITGGRSAVAGALIALLLPLAVMANDNAKAARLYEDALARYQKNDLPGAVIQLRNALQADKNNLAVQMLLAKVLLTQGDARGAEVAYLEALRLGVNRAEVIPGLARTLVAQAKHAQLFEHERFDVAGLPPAVKFEMLLLRASASADLGDYKAAFVAVDEARSLQPGNVEVWLTEVPLRIRVRQFREAQTAVDQALKLAPNAANAWYQKGSVAHVMGDRPGAQAAYTRALALDPAHVEALIARAGLFIDAGRGAEAAKDVAELRRIAPTETRGAYLAALLAEREGDGVAARAALRTITALLDPVPFDFMRYRPQLLMLAGLAQYGLGEREKAKPYLEAFHRGTPGSPVSKLLAQLHLSEGQLDQAIEVLDTYLRQQPNDGQALALKASALMAQGRHGKAAGLMQESLRQKESPTLRSVLGLSLIGSGQSGVALGELERAFRADPRQTQAGTALVGLYLRSQQTAKARAVADALVKQRPANPGFHNLLGMVKAQAGDSAGALAAYNQAIKLDDRFVAAKLNLARLEVAAKSYDAAAARLAALQKSDETNIDILLELALLADRRNQPAEAQRWLEKAVDHAAARELRPGLALTEFHLRRANPTAALAAARALSAKAPDELAVQLALARAQLAAGDAANARSTLSNATRTATYDAAVQVEVALLQMAAGNPAGAAYNLQKAFADKPDFLPAQVLMTEVEIRQGEHAKAEARARQIVQKQPQRAIGHTLLGDAAAARGQLPAAIDAYRKAHQTEPSTDTLLRLFNALYAHGGDRAPALQLAEQWVKARPQDRAVRRLLSDSYARLGRYPLAKQSYEALLKLTPDDPDALNNLANVLLRMKDPAAQKVAEQALARNASAPHALDTAGWAAHQAGQPERALQLLRDARLRDPGNAEIRFHLATVLVATGRRAEARDELETALKDKRQLESVAAAEDLLRSLK
ncbi:PEP-CTERM system TPR-repeat protein PrsT [Aquincola sp. S2]|uniref:PEP-CTERM system TPR-repeat protein PrsT n=1 Tax=Pseudaquabacterium terrae TaxID=2732868 RepID=A0ABX2ELU8_9BURK|nr:XrtA/PEP-CTERM system TPR-repeat protein PrsT [Aquabacterium terrae]NRF69568.1 PEP-CTERM system TPR-repeat protein PrsT [Aquabacterium terrae]